MHSYTYTSRSRHRLCPMRVLVYACCLFVRVYVCAIKCVRKGACVYLCVCVGACLRVSARVSVGANVKHHTIKTYTDEYMAQIVIKRCHRRTSSSNG